MCKSIFLFVTGTIFITIATAFSQASSTLPPDYVPCNTNNPGYFWTGMNIGWLPNINEHNRIEIALDVGMTLDRTAMNMALGNNQYVDSVNQRLAANPPSASYYWLNTSSGECQVPAGLYASVFTNGTNINPVNTYAFFVHDTVTKYKDKVKFWCLPNEPDIGCAWPGPPQDDGSDWDGWAGNTDEYAKLVEVFYRAAKAADPNCYVGVQVAYVAAMESLMRRGIGPYFDIADFHSYAWGPDAAEDNITEIYESMDQMLSSYGYDGITKPKKWYICTETGHSYSESGKQGSPENQIAHAMRNIAVGASLHLLSTVWYGLFTPCWGDMGLTGDVTSFSDANYTSLPKRDAYWAYKTTAKLLNYAQYKEPLSSVSGTGRGFVFYSTNEKKYRIMLWNRGTASNTFQINTTNTTAKKFHWDAWKSPSTGSYVSLTGTGNSLSVKAGPIPVIIELDQVILTNLIPSLPEPSLFTANQHSTNGINLTWSDNSTNEDGFRIFLSTVPVKPSLPLYRTAAKSGGPQSLIISNLSSCQTYHVWIDATNFYRRTAPLTLSVQTFCDSLYPTGVKATAVNPNTNRIRWNNNGYPGSPYNIYCSTNNSINDLNKASVFRLASGLASGTTQFSHILGAFPFSAKPDLRPYYYAVTCYTGNPGPTNIPWYQVTMDASGWGDWFGIQWQDYSQKNMSLKANLEFHIKLVSGDISTLSLDLFSPNDASNPGDGPMVKNYGTITSSWSKIVIPLVDFGPARANTTQIIFKRPPSATAIWGVSEIIFTGGTGPDVVFWGASNNHNTAYASAGTSVQFQKKASNGYAPSTVREFILVAGTNATISPLLNNTGILPPSGFAGEALTMSDIHLSWNPMSTASSYTLYRSFLSPYPEDATRIASLPLTVSDYTDRNLQMGSPYYYWIRQESQSAGPSKLSSSLLIITFSVPAKPTPPSVISASNGAAKVRWPRMSGVSSWTLFISADSNTNNLLALVGTASNITNCQLTEFGSSKMISLKAYNKWGGSAFSDLVQCNMSNTDFTAPTCLISPDEGLLLEGTVITITADDEPGGTGLRGIKITTDGSSPTNTSFQSSPLTLVLTKGMILSFFAEDYAGNRSMLRQVRFSVMAEPEDVAAYPNNLKGEGKIRFIFAKEMNARIEIFSVSGTRIRAFEQRSYGRNLWQEWDGKNENGSPLASGYYLAVITSDNGQRFTLKILIRR